MTVTLTVTVPTYPEFKLIPATLNALSTVAPLSQSGSKVAISDVPGAAPASPLPQPAGLVVFQFDAVEVLAPSAPTQYKVAASTGLGNAREKINKKIKQTNAFIKYAKYFLGNPKIGEARAGSQILCLKNFPIKIESVRSNIFCCIQLIRKFVFQQ